MGQRACESVSRCWGAEWEAGGGTVEHKSMGVTGAQGARGWVSHKAEFRAF